MLGAFQQHLAAAIAAGAVRPIPGAAATFGWLRSRGVELALATGFDRDTTTRLLAALGWESAARVVVCGDDVARGRPAPDLIRHAMAAVGERDPLRVAAVGDTTADLAAGAAAGVGWNVGVSTGAHSRERLAAAPHTHLIASVADLPGLWDAG